jgi:membrane protein DedA with SNARE-associated domain
VVLRLLSHFSYAAIFLVLVAAGLGVPFPEELTQLTAGFLAHRGVVSLWPAVATAYAGILAGDYLLFRLGRRHGPRILQNRSVGRVFTPSRRHWLERHFANHDVLTIMVARHASGLRLPVFAMAGALGVSSRTFLLADGISALLSVPLVVGLGYLFAQNLERIQKHIHEVELLVLALLFAGVTLVTWLRRRRRRRKAADT